MKRKIKAMQHTKPAISMKQLRITRKHGNYTKISLISITFPPHILRKVITRRVLPKLKKLWRRVVRFALISN